MENLKFYAKTNDDLESLLNTVMTHGYNLVWKNMQKSYLRKAH